MEDIGSEIRDALEHTVGDAAKRRDEEREFQQDCARLRFEAVSRLKGRWGDDRTARAEAAHRMRLAGLAQSAAGRSADLGEMPAFAGDATFSLRFDPDEVAELARMVRASFKTYVSVVRDNGVFAAFSEGSLFGRCVGQTSWLNVWDDWSMEEFDYDASEFLGAAGVREAVRSRIPSGVEEAEGDDDSLPVAIDRMRRFNTRRYFGMLDDDFKQHVDAFWYGFGKLMEFADGLVDLDICGFQQHCDRVVEQAAARCGDLALLMDDAQLEAYCDEIDALADRLRRWKGAGFDGCCYEEGAGAMARSLTERWSREDVVALNCGGRAARMR